MRVLVVTNMVPFVRGGAEELADHLVKNLNAHRGVAAEQLRLPFRWDPPDQLIDQMFIAQTLQLYNVDRVIGLKFPAYMIPHDHKTLWLLHQYRQAYDLWDLDQSNLREGPRGAEIRDLIVGADNRSFAGCRKIYALSQEVQRRLRTYNQVDSDVLMQPINDPEDFDGTIEDGGYIFAGGRITEGKRQRLLVGAMAHVKSNVKLVVGGPPESEDDARALRDLVDKHKMHDRVKLEFGYLDRAKISAYARGALACAAIPVNEDCPSYVVMEAFTCSKAVVTSDDSGGVLQIVIDRETGFVTPPTPRALAESFDRMYADRPAAARMGRSAKRILSDLRLTWPKTIERLLS
jgi:glycosyltransferase involved in cell wall biosynthesis